ncbi:hypothetical protein BW35_00228 [Micrococcus luteus]|nr:hypothetical protein BW35_00228 [Micrococcus luteus]
MLGVVGGAGRAADLERGAGRVGAVAQRRGRGLARDAPADGLGIGGEAGGQASGEHGQLAPPQSGVAAGLAVADDAAVELVDLGEAAVLEQGGEDLAAHAARAVGDQRRVLEVVQGPGVDGGEQVAGGVRVRDHGPVEAADGRLHRVAAVEEAHGVRGAGALGDQRVHLDGREPLPRADDPVRVHGDALGGPERDELGLDLDREAGEVRRRAVRPLHFEVPERRMLPRAAHVALDGVDRSADGPVDPLRRHDDPAGQAEGRGERALPQPHRLGVGERGEPVVQRDAREGGGAHQGPG